MNEWQPIKTAPTDRSAVLLYEDADEGLGIFVGYYAGPRMQWQPLCGGLSWEPHPSHWMPLPNKPAAVSSEKRS